MEPLSNYLRHKYPNVIPMLSNVNEGRTEQDIEESAHRLAIEVKNFLNVLEMKEFEVSFICHSMGGLIARASLKYLQSHKTRFNHFVTICSPHLGYLYHSSALISTSLWILNKLRKDPSMIQLTMEDNSDPYVVLP
jgi:surfactin synthase thioesterase subunit